MLRGLIVLLACFTLWGCQQKQAEFIKYRDDGQMKPRVAFLPVIDRSSQQLPWNVSTELTEGMRLQMMHGGNVYLTETGLVRNAFETRSPEEWLTEDLSAYNIFSGDHDFVVVLELTEHGKEPYQRQEVRPVYPAKGEIDSVLKMAVRIKIIDIRQEYPVVVLNQYLHSNHLIPKRRKPVDYQANGWKAERFRDTPVGAAHARLERDVVAQLERYITYHAQ